ncbi:MAG TPA: Gmad2 immunoglobulin-like domain-containing protein [Candidatus Limnocylindria bacterium]|nr:Gmad2 immunoglobulin-like domain-containing protein [Candidatus Limnocylindria bacterium]
MRQDDEIIGRALSRAIETIDVNQTPFERSRIATAPARRSIFGLWQIATAAGAIVLALAIGSWLTRPTEGPGVAASPTGSVVAATPSPTTTPSPAVASPNQDRIWVYFARDGVPPTAAFVRGSFLNSSPESRIASRITALGSAAAVSTGPSEVPSGAITALTLEASRGIAVRVQGDLATVEFNVPSGWGVRGSAQSQALLQQLVYTITEEPGIRRALITETGKPNAVIDQLVVDKPLSREDVSGYVSSGSVDPLQIAGASTAAQLSTSYSVDSLAPGLARFVITFDYGTAGALTDPQFSATLFPATNATSGKDELEITVPNGSDTTTTATQVDRSPLRWIAVGKSNSFRSQTYRLGLDDQRPWRAIVLANPTRIVIDIGGDPRAVSDRIAVTAPKPGDKGVAHVPPQFAYDFQLTGAARVFEANVTWRVRDSAGRIVSTSHFLASLGNSAVWGTFDSGFSVPAGVHGNVTLEVYEVSPKDGSDQGLVRIPLSVP